MSRLDPIVVELDASHHAYVREQFVLHASTDRLLGRLLGTVDRGSGRMWAVVPAGRAAMAVADLETDAIRTDSEREAVTKVIARRLSPLLASNPPRMLAIEYWMGVEVLEASPAHAFKVGDSQFDYVTASDSAERVTWFLQCALWYPTVGMIAPVPSGVDLAQTRELTVAQIEEAVSDLDLVLIGAWTADGYVFWEPEDDRGQVESP